LVQGFIYLYTFSVLSSRCTGHHPKEERMSHILARGQTIRSFKKKILPSSGKWIRIHFLNNMRFFSSECGHFCCSFPPKKRVCSLYNSNQVFLVTTVQKFPKKQKIKTQGLWSWYWVQDWISAGMKQLYTWCYWDLLNKIGTRLVLPQVRIMLISYL
jgi:hypothetical protein